MKILIHNYKFNGGAPQSTLEYAKIAQQKYEVVAVGEVNYKDNIVKNYEKSKINIINHTSFDIERPISNFNLLLKYSKIIMLQKPNLIHSVTFPNMYYDYIVSKSLGIPVIYMIAGGIIPVSILRTMNHIFEGDTIICFSRENTVQLGELKANNNVHEFPNRLTFENIKTSNIYKLETDQITAVLISRLDEGKINSVIATMNLFKEINRRGFDVKLIILGDGSYSTHINNLAREINIEMNNIIILKGHSDIVDEYILNAHVILGKGRSVLDGVFRNRLSVVVNENKEFYLVNESSFGKLKDYNFTGRNSDELTQLTLNNFLDILKDIKSNQICYSDLERTNLLAKKYYDILEISDEILEVYNKNIESDLKYKLNYFKLIYNFFKINYILIKSKLVGIIKVK